jgi:uncharacterized protein (TIGR02284 family)
MNNELNRKAVEALNELIEKNYDTEKGYKEAAKEAENHELKDFFTKSIKQRYDFGHELKAEIAKLGGSPRKETSITTDLHHLWINLKSLVGAKDVEVVVDECERVEKAAVEDYEKILKMDELNMEVKALIHKQLQLIRFSLEHLTQLKERFITS